MKGAIVAGTLAPLGVGFVVLDRWLNLGNSYGVIAGLSLIVTALINQEGIAGATRKSRRSRGTRGFRRGHRRRRFGGNTDGVTRLDRSD